jgi:hypothetical protein
MIGPVPFSIPLPPRPILPQIRPASTGNDPFIRLCVEFLARTGLHKGEFLDLNSRFRRRVMQFALMRDACRGIGWDSEIFAGIGPVLGRNVRWLPGYRQDSYRPSERAAAHIIEAFTEAVAFDAESACAFGAVAASLRASRRTPCPDSARW